MTNSDRSRRLLAAVSVLGVSLGMAAPALAHDPTAVENPTATGQTSQKGTQTTQKVATQTSFKAPTDQTSQNVSTADQNAWKAPAGSDQTSQKGTTAWGGGVGDTPAH
jgi:hypothetical protein